MKKVKLILINLTILSALLVLIDPWMKPSHKSTGRYVRLREPAPNMNHSFKSTNSFVNILRTNDQGFYIGGDNPMHLDSVDIIFFGGSTTECSVVQESKRFPYLTGEKIVDSKNGQKIETLNGGLSGNNTVHSLISLIAKGIPLKPKVVVLMHNINDLSQLRKTGSYWNSPEERSIIVNQIKNNHYKNRFKNTLKSLKELLIPNLYQILSQKIKSLKSNSNDEWKDYRQVKTYNIDTVLRKFDSSINSFIKVAQFHNIDVVLMTQFNRLNPDDTISRKAYKLATNLDDYDQICIDYAKFNQKIREISISNNVHLIDLAKEVPGDSTAIFDFVHLNTKGSELVTDIITKHLVEFYPNYSLSKK